MENVISSITPYRKFYLSFILSGLFLAWGVSDSNAQDRTAEAETIHVAQPATLAISYSERNFETLKRQAGRGGITAEAFSNWLLSDGLTELGAQELDIGGQEPDIVIPAPRLAAFLVDRRGNVTARTHLEPRCRFIDPGDDFIAPGDDFIEWLSGNLRGSVSPISLHVLDAEPVRSHREALNRPVNVLRSLLAETMIQQRSANVYGLIIMPLPQNERFAQPLESGATIILLTTR